MKKRVSSILLILSFYLISGGARCGVKICPPQAHNYTLHHITEKGFKHIFTIEENCSGCHHIVAQKCGLIKIEKIKVGKNGVFIAKIEKIKGISCKKESSTFFPEHWSVQTTLNKIEEAYQNSYVISKNTKPKYDNDDNDDNEHQNSDGRRTYDNEVRMGKTSEGITIKIIMDNENSDKIFNAYPVLEE